MVELRINRVHTLMLSVISTIGQGSTTTGLIAARRGHRLGAVV